MFTRRSVLLATAAGLAGLGSAQAQGPAGWPKRPVRCIVPSAAGGPAENFRIYLEHFREAFGQSFVLENQPGASGAIGGAAVARAAPDGHTLLCAANSHVILAPLVAQNATIDVKRDFEPIGLIMTYPFCLLVNSDLPVKSLQELAAYGKANPGKLNFGSLGIGTGGHLIAELFCKRAGIQAVHIPFTGAAPQVAALAAGTLQFTVDTVGNSRGTVDAGKVRRLAVTGAKRTSAAPETPTFEEQGFANFDLELWLGLLGPKGIAGDIVEALNREIRRCSEKPEVQARLRGLAYEPERRSAQEFAAHIDRELKVWGEVVRETGVRIPA